MAFLLFGLSSKFSYEQCVESDIINLRKIAIVFGEKDYKYAPALNNPLNDASDISDSLKKLGFEVYTYPNTDYKSMNAAIDNWCEKIPNYDVALFYYSGHGAEVNGQNYLFPTDANPKGPSDLFYDAYSANKLLDRMEIGNAKFNIIILDACRNNPFTRGWSKSISSSGLVSMVGRGSFIAFAASPGTTASDGDGRNGTYTEGILKSITVPNMTIDQIFTHVNSYVRSKTSEAQIPYKNSSLSVDFCFSVNVGKEKKLISKTSFIQPSSGILLSSSGDKLVVLDSLTKGILVKDTKTLIDLSSIANGLEGGFKITSRYGSIIYIIDSTQKKLNIFDLNLNVIIKKIDLGLVPISVVVSPDEKTVYIGQRKSDSSGNILVMDLVLFKPIKVIEVAGCPNGIILSPDGKYLYAVLKKTSIHGSLLVLETKSNKIVKSINGLTDGNAVGLTPDGKVLYCSSKKEEVASNFVNVIDPISFKVLRTVNVKSMSFSFTSDNKYVLVCSDFDVSVLKTDSNEVINDFPFVTQPGGVSISSDGTAYVWLPRENTIKVLKLNDYASTNSSFILETRFKNFKDDLKRESASDSRNQLKKIFERLNDTLYTVVNKLAKELGEPYQSIQSGIDYNYKESFYTNRLGIESGYDISKIIWPQFKGEIVQDVLVVSLKEKVDEAASIYKSSVSNINWNKISQFIREYFLKNVNQLR